MVIARRNKGNKEPIGNTVRKGVAILRARERVTSSCCSDFRYGIVLKNNRHCCSPQARHRGYAEPLECQAASVLISERMAGRT